MWEYNLDLKLSATKKLLVERADSFIHVDTWSLNSRDNDADSGINRHLFLR